jgi:hypothetical protein
MRRIETIGPHRIAKLLAACAVLLAAALNAPAAFAQQCAAVDKTGTTTNAGVYLKVVPETAWRPRGGEVWFQVTSQTPFNQVQVCFVWPDGTSPMPSTIVRRLPAADAPVTDDKTITYAALVPEMKDAAHGWAGRIMSGAGTGLGTVPEALMVVKLGDGATPLVLTQYVGITSAIAAAVLVAMLLGLVYLALWAVAGSREPTARRRWGGSLLWLITGADGYASLSQFQIILWTITVAASAVYVMTLSGNLLELTSGVLILLGIASGAALIARVPSKLDTMRGKRGDLVEAHWSDVVVVDGMLDVTRVQMLIFTLVSAAFVVLKVVVGYRIPVIPDNFLLLMGISNGVYLTGRNLPDGGATPPPATGPKPTPPPPTGPAQTSTPAPAPMPHAALATSVNRPPPQTAAPAAPLATSVNTPAPGPERPSNSV